MRQSLGRGAAALVVAAGALVSAAPPASAQTVIAMPNCCATDEIADGDAVYVLSQQFGGPERATLVRVDPTNNSITGELVLPTGMPTGNSVNAEGIAVAAGSLWIPAGFHNEVLRIDPETMRVVARIAAGRSPGSVVSDGSSIWVALQEGAAMVRIDPALNAVVQTVRVGRRDLTDGPWQATYAGSQILISMPGSGRVAHLDPRIGRVVGYDDVGADAASCAHILPAPGGYWLDDTECSFTYYRWDAASAQITAQINPQPRNDFGSVVVGNAIYTGEFRCNAAACTRGFLVKYDAVTGMRLAQRVIDTDDAVLPHFVRGTFWVAHSDAGTVQRVALF